MPVHLDPARAPAADGLLHHGADAPGVPRSVHYRIAVEPVRARGDDPPNARVRRTVIRAERGEENGSADPCPGSPPQVGAERGIGVPWAGQSVPFAGVAVAVDDHLIAPIMPASRRTAGRAPSAISTARTTRATSACRCSAVKMNESAMPRRHRGQFRTVLTPR